MRRPFFVLLSFLLCMGAAQADTFRLSGVQESELSYQMVQEVAPGQGIRKLKASFVMPASFASPTFTQTVEESAFYFSPEPDSREQRQDELGNTIVTVGWENPAGPIRSTLKLSAQTTVSLDGARPKAAYPLAEIPEQERIFLEQSPLTQASPDLAQRARSLCAGKSTEEEAVSAILNDVADRMTYEPMPPRNDAAYAYQTGRGNCQGYANLAIAMLRAAGIPARAASGVTWKEPYTIKAGRVRITMNMATGRHAWIEVFFPELGWLPYNPQNSQLFVSSRFLRLEAGRDTREASRDGMVSWVQQMGARSRPQVREIMTTALTADRTEMTGQKASPEPRALMLLAHAGEPAGKTAAPAGEIMGSAAAEAAACASSDAAASRLPVSMGNTSFPAGVDFAALEGTVTENPDGSMSLTPNPLVETAEYVTSRGRQYAQAFAAEGPIRVSRVSMALKNFGDQGQIWAEIYEDDDGRPGDLLFISDFLDLSSKRNRSWGPGYQWVDFPFPEKPRIGAGRHWVALGFSGPAIVNWFYTYGNPSKLPEPVVARSIFEPGWPELLANEFIFLVRGSAAGAEENKAAPGGRKR